MICNELISRGYIEVIKTSGEHYDGKDMYFCVQAPDLYLLKITQGGARIEKIGKSNFSGELSTKVQSVHDIENLHKELNNIIINQDESSIKNKSTGCLVSIAILFGFSCLTYYLLNP